MIGFDDLFLTARVALDVGFGEGIEGTCVGGCVAVGTAAALQKGGHGVGRRVLSTLCSSGLPAGTLLLQGGLLQRAWLIIEHMAAKPNSTAPLKLFIK